jgi:homoserine dehydrogenase
MTAGPSVRVCRVAIAGFGGVGRAVADMLLARRARYRRVYGVEIRLVAVCGSRAGLADTAGLEADRLTALEDGKSGPDFIAASDADILIEAGPSDFRTGGPGLAYIRAALADGRDAIVISKGALVFDGRNLRDLAHATGAVLKISGATAAALPAIDLLDYNLRGCAILRIDGILNATTNYLLDAMTARGLGFEAALAEARSAGFAERDPSNDTHGWDTASKLLILANFGLGCDLGMNDIAVDGIQSVTAHHIERWRRDAVVPRLVGSLWWEAGVARARVGLRTYPQTDPFAHVSGKGKAIRIATDTMGDIVAMGSGPEPAATAAAALKDLEHILSGRAAGGAGTSGAQR